jgi:hypothetical protein
MCSRLMILFIILLVSQCLYFIILLCLMADDFTCQEESADAQWLLNDLQWIQLY